MSRISISLSVACGLLLCCQPVNAQQQNKEIELLKKENELLKKEIELLKRQIEQVKNRPGKVENVETGTKPSASVEGVEYVVDKATRVGDEVALEILATSSKGDKSLTITHLEAVDTEGNVSTTKGGQAAEMQLRFRPLRLREGIKTRFVVIVDKVQARATGFSQFDITPSAIGFRANEVKKTIKFKNVRFGK